jgi:formylglycine-generating enzyme required for sulfatase activity
MGKNPSRFKGEKLPVETVSWRDCQEFIGGLNDLNVAPRGFLFAMPTEAQWEYACRAGTTTAFHSGGSLNARLANFDTRATSEVGSFPANAWGLRDMHGNVWEWCADGYSGDYSGGAVTDPLGVSPNQSQYVVRGGSFYNQSWLSRSASRDYYSPTKRDYHIGFRLALVPTGETNDVVDAPGNPPSQPSQPTLKTVKDIAGNVEQFLREMEWPSEKFEGKDSVVIYKVVLNDRPYNLVYFVRTNEEQLVVLAVLDEKIAASHRGAVNEYLTRVNFDLHVGNFEMNLSDGETHFRVSIDVEHGVINPTIVKQLTLGYAISVTDRYLPGIKEVIGGSEP